MIRFLTKNIRTILEQPEFEESPEELASYRYGSEMPADDGEFEEAAKTRDEIRKLEASELEIGINPKLRKLKSSDRIYPEGRSTQGKPGTKPKRKR